MGQNKFHPFFGHIERFWNIFWHSWPAACWSNSDAVLSYSICGGGGERGRNAHWRDPQKYFLKTDAHAHTQCTSARSVYRALKRAKCYKTHILSLSASMSGSSATLDSLFISQNLLLRWNKTNQRTGICCWNKPGNYGEHWAELQHRRMRLVMFGDKVRGVGTVTQYQKFWMSKSFNCCNPRKFQMLSNLEMGWPNIRNLDVKKLQLTAERGERW